MAYVVIKSISMSAFMECALALELPHIYVLFFPNPFINLLSSPTSLYLHVSFYKVSSYRIAIWDWGGH